MGEPDEPFSVEQVCRIFELFTSSKDFNIPYETAAFFPFGY